MNKKKTLVEELLNSSSLYNQVRDNDVISKEKGSDKSESSVPAGRCLTAESIEGWIDLHKVCTKSEVRFKKLHEKAVIPAYAHEYSAGMDMTAIGIDYDPDNDVYVYHTGIACETDPGILAFLMPRSSNYKTEVYLANGIGLIDTAEYRGEIKFMYKPRTSIYQQVADLANSQFAMAPWYKKLTKKKRQELWADMYVKARQSVLLFIMEGKPYDLNDKIGQIVFMSYPKITATEVDELSESERGTGGFGSTGK